MTPNAMEKTKKRKRDVELPRITYNAASRTFDRLFKEDSLDEMKDVVRKKMNLSVSIPVYLSQIRDGRSVDLEDDDDFEAFQCSAFSASSARVQVVLGESPIPIEITSQSARRKKKKKSNSNMSAFYPSTAGPANNGVEVDHASQTHRVTFYEPSDLPTTPYEREKKTRNGFTSDVQDTSPEADPPAKRTGLPSGTVSSTIPLEDSEIISEKKKRKKKKKDTSIFASQIPELVSTTQLREATEMTRDTDAQPTANDAVRPAKESNKRKRAGSPTLTRPAEQTNPKSQKLPALATFDRETPSNNDDSEDLRARKKSKKKTSKPLDETPADEPVPAQSIPAPINPATQLSSELPTELTDRAATQSKSDPKKQSRKKEKASVEYVKKPANLQSSELVRDKSEEATTLKKSKNSRRKSLVQPLGENLTSAPQPSEEQRPEESGLSRAPTKSKGKSKKIEEAPKEISKDSDLAQKGPVETRSEMEAGSTAAPEVPKKTPKKTNEKKIEIPKATDASQLSQDDTPAKKDAAPQEANFIGVDKQVTKAMVDAILARCGVHSKTIVQVTTPPVTPVLIAPEKPQPSDNTRPANTQPTQVTEKKSQPKAAQDKVTTMPAKCDVCEESPPHARTRCPIIKAGIRSMRKRVAELLEEAPEGSKIVAELQTLIEKRTRKPRASGVPKLNAPALQEANPPATNHVSDTPVQMQSSSTQPLYSAQPLPPPKPTSTPLLTPSSQPPPVTLRSPSLQPPPSSQAQASKSASSQNIVKHAKPSMAHSKTPNLDEISLGTTFLELRDVSTYTEKDLQALVRGPKISLADVPSPDASDEDHDDDDDDEEEEEEEEGKVLGKEPKLPPHLTRMGYPDSSDESDDEDEDVSPGVPTLSKSALIQPDTARLSSGPEVSSAEGTERGNRSFQDVEALGSSRELDRTGDNVVNDAVDADLALISPSKASQPTHKSRIVDSDTSVFSGGPETRATGLEKIPPASAAIEKAQALDPIEPSENPQASQPESIVSDDEVPLAQSTPKDQITVRTRSQRNKAPAPTPAATQNATSHELVDEANEPPKPTRRTRSLTKISELPIPPNPSVRIIRPPSVPTTTVRTRRQIAQEESQEQEAPEPTPVKGKKTPAVKTTAKPKAATKPPTKTPVKPPPKTVANGKVPASAKSILTNGLNGGKTRGSKATAANASPPEVTGPNTSTENEHPVTSWVVLQESQASQVDTETPGMLDELLPSPSISPTISKGQKARVNGSSRVPLFVHADSQQSFPYSQYPDLSSKVTAVSPNDSEDENEVEATVVAKPSMFRTLTEIQRSVKFEPRRHSSQIINLTRTPVTDYYGPSTRQEDSEESGSDSDSEAEGKKVASHIPPSRRAGVAVLKRS